MSVFGLAFYFSLGGNMLIQWGLIPSRKAETGRSPLFIVFFLVVSAAASAVYGSMFRYALTPWGMESIAPVLFVLLLAGAYAAFRALLKVLGKAEAFRYEGAHFQSTLALYAIAMMAGGRFTSAWFMLGGGASAAFGYLAATRFLDDIVERIELEPIPAPFRGAPIRFISAGLIALAFAGVDAGFFARFSG